MSNSSLRDFLNSKFIKDNPRALDADFEFELLGRLNPEERRQAESILLSRLNAGHDPRALLALAEIGSERAIEPLLRYRERIRSESAALSRDGLILQATLALWRISRDPALVVPDLLALLREAQMGNARREAAVALADFARREVADGLLAALRDSLGMVREQAAMTLLQICDVDAPELPEMLLRRDETRNAEAITALEALVNAFPWPEQT